MEVVEKKKPLSTLEKRLDESDEVAMMPPVAFVERSALATFEIARLVVVAPPPVREVKLARPVFDTEKRVVVAEAVEDAIEKSVVLVSVAFWCTENLAYGEVVPIPTSPLR